MFLLLKILGYSRSSHFLVNFRINIVSFYKNFGLLLNLEINLGKTEST